MLGRGRTECDGRKNNGSWKRKPMGYSAKRKFIVPNNTSYQQCIAFKIIFTEPSNEQLLVKLIEFFLPGIHIQTLTLNDKEQHGLILSDKSCTFDLFCTTDSGEQIIVEMQYSSQESLRDRMLYYSTFPIRSQLMDRFKGLEDGGRMRKKMDYSLRPVYVISILNFKMEHERAETLEEGMISRYDLRSERSGELMTDALHFVYLELGRLPWKEDEQEKCRTLLEQLAFSLKYGHLLSMRPQEFEDKLLQMLFEAMAFANMTETELKNYNAIMTTELDIIARQNFARDEGRAEGLAAGLAEGEAKGRTEGRLSTLREMVADGLVTIDVLKERYALSEEDVAAILQSEE